MIPEEMIRTEQETSTVCMMFIPQIRSNQQPRKLSCFASDESYFLLCSLEVLDDEGNFKRKADMFTKRTINPTEK